jgi:predicted metal-dependent phosphoesterase TrpH
MLIDLHTHTYPCSSCSVMSAAALIEAAIERGLDAVCVTDHHATRGGFDAQALAREKYTFTVFRGVEARTTLGDVLVFGLDEDFPEAVDGPELLRRVHERGGASVLAHPFRRNGGWGLWYWLEQQGQVVDASLAARPELVHLHAVETFNGHVSAQELALAEDLARVLGLPTCGGSDAHDAQSVGVTATEFARPVADELALVRELREGRVRPRRLR